MIRGPGTMLGYWNDPEATAATLVDGWLRTGDIGVIDDRGLLKFVDRAKDIIISGGLNISAAEVERVLMDHPGVEEVAVLAAPDDRFGETPLAVVHGAPELATPSLIDHCGEHLAAFKVPRYLVLSDEPLPRLATGKISKPALRERYLATGDLPLACAEAQARFAARFAGAGRTPLRKLRTASRNSSSSVQALASAALCKLGWRSGSRSG